MTADQSRGGFGDYGSRLNLGRVESYDFVKNEQTKQIVLDSNGNAIPTGLLNIVLLESSDAPRTLVPFVVPLSGNTLYMGGMPEIGALCIVGWRQQNQPVIIGFMPPSIDKLTQTRQTVPNLAEGEVFIQSANRTVDVDNTPNFFRGARVYLDRYGRIQIDTQDYNLTVGYLLSDEYTSSVSFVRDPITNEPIFLREKLPGGVERRVDDKGNAVWTYGGRCVTKVGASYELDAEEANRQTSGSVDIGDVQENKLSIDGGLVSLQAPSGSLERFSEGSEDVVIGGNKNTSVMGELTTVIGQDKYANVAGSQLEEIAGNYKQSVAGGESLEQVVDGKKIIVATTGITLETEDLAPVKHGSESADQPAVLGTILATAIKDLLTILQMAPGIGFGNLGGPVPLNPAIVTAIEAWIVRYIDTVATNILSSKVFNEKGSAS